MSSQAMPAPWALQPTKTRERVNREDVRAAGKARGAALRSHRRRKRGPVTSRTDHNPAGLPGPTVSFPVEPGLAPEACADAERA